jgi:DNA-binding LacI/PurR family transcriptional regulator
MLGRKDLAYFGPCQSVADMGAMERAETFAVCASERRARVRFALLPDDPKEIDDCIKAWRAEGAPDGVCCFDDDYALRLLASAHRLGWKVPEEVSVIGVNDVSWAAHSSPPLTTIHFDYAYTVGGLLNHALAQSGLASPSEPPKKGLGLVIRKSCGGQETMDLKTLAPILSDACKIPVDIYSMP